MTDLELLERARRGLTPEQYEGLMAERAAADPADAAPDEAEKIEFTKLNLHRSRRIARTWRPSGELVAAVKALGGPQVWLALTEPWCGDSAQCLPHFTILAGLRPDLDMRLLLRDDNPEVMDRFLTDGKRSIPIVIGLDDGGRELWRWGPRPAAAQAVFDEAKAEGLEKPEILERLHLFYGRDRGRAMEAELLGLFGGQGS